MIAIISSQVPTRKVQRSSLAELVQSRRDDRQSLAPTAGLNGERFPFALLNRTALSFAVCYELTSSEASLCGEHAFNPRIDARCEVHCARKCLEARFDNVVRILTAHDVDVKVHSELIREGL